MQVERVTYRRLLNTGNYNNETVELTAIVNEGDKPVEVFDELKALADDMLLGRAKRMPDGKDPF